jgi:hypothetical protein
MEWRDEIRESSPRRRSVTRQNGRRISLRAVTITAFFVVLSALVTLSWDDISQPRYEHIDFAANSILIDEALTLDLLHGNYSRAGFYHPGPALLYVQAGSQLIFHDLLGVVPTPYNAHLLGIFILNATSLALAARILYRNTRSLWSVGLLIVIAFAYSLHFDSAGLGGLLSSTWMPHVYVWPYLLLLVSGASVAVGHGEDLWVFALASGLLVHGHVSFFLPVLVFVALVAVAWVIRHRGRWPRAIPISSRTSTAIVLALFILPLALQLITDFPGQFGNYVNYLRETELPPRDLGTVIRFVAQYWGFGAASAPLVPTLALAAVASTYFAAPGPRRMFHLALLFAGVVASATTALFAFSGVDDFTHTYLALFYVAVPIVFWTVLGTNLVDRWVKGRPVLTAAVGATIVIAWLVILVQPASGSLYNGSDVGAAYDSLDRALGPDEPIALSFAEHNDWAVTVGLLEQARRDGRPACVRVGPGIFEILFTTRNVCPKDTGDRTEALVTAMAGPPTPQAVLLYDGANYDIWRLDG